MCVDYDQKTSLVENKMLKLQLKSIATCRFKAKNIPEINTDEMKNDLEDFTNEIVSTQRVDELRQNVMDMQSIVLQFKNDVIGQKLKKQMTADALLAEAKKKQ
ncbi:jg9842 [Pararge aegeria aegeria]|uniref:Jg9842 protein n=1 Tax=Pararge aegeria aegeria TaxID=348720 RepID=A0A8S4RTN3_9NEOP|nr:jg9842 [Pararge aegeria aegeria]